MAILLTCSCGQQYQVSEQYAGQQVKCPQCGQVLVISATSIQAPPPGASPSPHPASAVEPDIEPSSSGGTLVGCLLLAFVVFLFLGAGLGGVVYLLVKDGRLQTLLANHNEDSPGTPADDPTVFPGAPVDPHPVQPPPPNPEPPPPEPSPAPQDLLPPPSATPWHGHLSMIYTVAFTANGQRALTGSGGLARKDGKQIPSLDTSLRLWDTAGKETGRIVGFTRGISCVSFSRDGRNALVGTQGEFENGVQVGEGAEVQLWDLEQKRLVRSFASSRRAIFCVDFSADGKYALAGGADLNLRVHEVQTGKERYLLVGHLGAITSAVFSPDGRYVLSGSADRTVRLWDLKYGREEKQLRGHEDIVWAVAFSPDGQYALSGGGLQKDPTGTGYLPGARDHAIRLWEIPSGTEVRRFTGHQGAVSCLAFSRDGQWVASGDNEGTVHLWRVQTGRELARFQAHKGLVRSVAFFPDDTRVLSGGEDARLGVWKVPPGVTQLAQQLSGTDPSILGSAVETLRRYGPEARRAVPALLTFVGRAIDVNLRRKGLAALKEIGPPGEGQASQLVKLLDSRSFPEGRRYALEMCARLKGSALPDQAMYPLLAALKDRDPQTRRQAALLLGTMGERARVVAYRPLLDGLRDEDSEVVQAARKALAGLGSSAKLDLLLLPGLLGDRSEAVRRFALERLASLGNQADPALPDLIAVAEQDPSVELRCQAIQALSQINPKDRLVVLSLLRAVSDREVRIRRKVAQALGKVPLSAGSLPGLLEALDDADEVVRQTAAESLNGAVLNKDHVPALARALKNTDKPFRLRLLRLLDGLGKEAAAAVPELVSILDKMKGEDRQQVITLLGKLGPSAKEAGPALARLLDDADRPTRFLLCETLGKIKAEEVKEGVPFLVRCLYLDRPDDEQLQADLKKAQDLLVEIGTPAVPGILKALTGDYSGSRPRNPQEALKALARTQAIITLGKMGSKANTREVLFILAKIEGNKQEDPTIRRLTRKVRGAIQK